MTSHIATTDDTQEQDPTAVSDEQVAAVSEAENLLQKAADDKGAAVGLDAGTVRVQKVNWKQILEEGFQLEVNVHGASMWTTLNAEDVGIVFKDEDSKKAWERNISGMKIGTMPKKIRDRAQKLKAEQYENLRDYASPTFLGYLIRLHPAVPERNAPFGANFKAWYEKATQTEQEYAKLRQRIVDEKDDLLAEMRGELSLIAIQVYDMLKTAGQDIPPLEQFRDEFVSKRMAKVVNGYDEMVAAMYMEIKVRDIPLASAMAEDQAKAEQILLDKAKLESEKAIVTEVARLKRETLEKDIKGGTATLLNDLRNVTHQLLYEVTYNVQKAIMKNGEVPGGSVRSLRTLVEKLQNLQVVPDEELEQRVSEVQALLQQASLNDNVGDTVSTMRQISAYALLTLKEMDRDPDLARQNPREVSLPTTVKGLQKLLGSQRTGGARQFSVSVAAPVASIETESSSDGESRSFI